MNDASTTGRSDVGRGGAGRRAAVLLAVMVVATAAYLAALKIFDLAHTARERIFAAVPDTTEKLRIYLDPISIDPVDDSLQLRIYVTPGDGLLGGAAGTLNRDVTLTIVNDGNREQRVLHAHDAVPPVIVQVDLGGDGVVAYPFDRYHLDLRLQAREGIPDAPGTPIAIETTVWEQLLGFRLGSALAGVPNPGDVGLKLEIRRADAQIFFALAAYLSMAVVACCALAISGFVFVGQRKVEAALTCALGPMVFALPALRNSLPGAPPLGVRADLAVFLWAELAVVFALALFVYCWACQRP